MASPTPGARGDLEEKFLTSRSNANPDPLRMFGHCCITSSRAATDGFHKELRGRLGVEKIPWELALVIAKLQARTGRYQDGCGLKGATENTADKRRRPSYVAGICAQCRRSPVVTQAQKSTNQAKGTEKLGSLRCLVDVGPCFYQDCNYFCRGMSVEKGRMQPDCKLLPIRDGKELLDASHAAHGTGKAERELAEERAVPEAAARYPQELQPFDIVANAGPVSRRCSKAILLPNICRKVDEHARRVVVVQTHANVKHEVPAANCKMGS